MKRRLVIALIACSLLQPQACWANETSSQLENIIMCVKDKIEIPSELSEFNYNLYDDTWNLSWHRKDHNESMDISCTSEGNILSYYHSKDEENSSNSQLAQIDVEEAKQIAEDFLKKVVPEYAEDLAVSDLQLPTSREDYDFDFYLTHEGVKVYNRVVSISVDKESGIIENFNGFKFDSSAQYDTSVPAFTEVKAQSLYLSKIGLPLGYHTYFDNMETKRAFLAYSIEDDEVAISAKTGEKIKAYRDEERVYAGGAKDEGMGAAESIKAESEALSPAEKEAVEETKDYMSVETIKKKMSTYFPALKAMSVLNTSVQKDSFGNRRYMNLGIKEDDEIVAETDISCDAKTGELYSYNYYIYNDDRKEVGEKWTKEQAQAFVQEVSPEQSSAVSFTSNTMNAYNKNLQNLTFTRMYKGIPVCDEGIEITYSTALNEVISYNVNWDKNILFPSREGILSKENVVKNIGLKLCYMQTGEHTYALVYGIEPRCNLFDAFSGKMLDWQGQEITSATSSFYTDIKGNKAEEIIKKLYNSGIYLEGPMLKPDEAITQQELLRLLEQATAWFEGDTQTYEIALRQGLLEESEKAPDKQLRRGEGIKYIINATSYKKLAMRSDIYEYPYKDEKVNEVLKGYVAVAYGLNILDNKADKFAPEELLTKADAMVMLYNLLQNR